MPRKYWSKYRVYTSQYTDSKMVFRSCIGGEAVRDGEAMSLREKSGVRGRVTWCQRERVTWFQRESIRGIQAKPFLASIL